jgi:DNA-binding MarR family transcriptional regulator
MSVWTAEEATRELLSVLPLLSRIMAAELRHDPGDDTTMPQFRVLAYLSEGPLTLSAIAKLRRVSLQSAGDLVQGLVERGWITRTPDPNDRRQSLLHLTDSGRTKYEQSQDRILHRLTPLMENLNDAELDAVQVALAALHRVLAGQEVTEDDNERG